MDTGRSKIVFIAGPYFGDGTHEVIEQNIREAEEYQIALVNRGIICFCAHNHTKHFEQKANASEEFYKTLDMAILQRACDAVVALPRWKSSSGARNEVQWAKENRIPIFFPTSPHDLDEIEKWAHT